MSGVFADQQGMGDYVAARMAAEDFGGKVLGAPIEVIQADLQNKVDVGLAIARDWIDEEQVDAIFGLGNSAVALAVQELCQQRQRIDVVDRRRHHRPDRQGVLALRRALDLRQLFRRQGAGDHAGEAGQEEMVLHHLGLRLRPFAGGQRDRDPEGARRAGARPQPGAARGDAITPRNLLSAAASGAQAVGICRGRRGFHQHRQADGRVRPDRAASCRRR